MIHLIIIQVLITSFIELEPFIKKKDKEKYESLRWMIIAALIASLLIMGVDKYFCCK